MEKSSFQERQGNILNALDRLAPTTPTPQVDPALLAALGFSSPSEPAPTPKSLVPCPSLTRTSSTPSTDAEGSSGLGAACAPSPLARDVVSVYASAPSVQKAAYAAETIIGKPPAFNQSIPSASGRPPKHPIRGQKRPRSDIDPHHPPPTIPSPSHPSSLQQHTTPNRHWTPDSKLTNSAKAAVRDILKRPPKKPNLKRDIFEPLEFLGSRGVDFEGAGVGGAPIPTDGSGATVRAFTDENILMLIRTWQASDPAYSNVVVYDTYTKDLHNLFMASAFDCALFLVRHPGSYHLTPGFVEKGEDGEAIIYILDSIGDTYGNPAFLPLSRLVEEHPKLSIGFCTLSRQKDAFTCGAFAFNDFVVLAHHKAVKGGSPFADIIREDASSYKPRHFKFTTPPEKLLLTTQSIAEIEAMQSAGYVSPDLVTAHARQFHFDGRNERIADLARRMWSQLTLSHLIKTKLVVKRV